jgi:hypothetical protein
MLGSGPTTPSESSPAKVNPQDQRAATYFCFSTSSSSTVPLLRRGESTDEDRFLRRVVGALRETFQKRDDSGWDLGGRRRERLGIGTYEVTDSEGHLG